MDNSFKETPEGNKKVIVYDSCPHCGRILSPWEKVLLSVDRMLMCRGCWYKIVLEDNDENKPGTNNEK